MDYRDDSSSLSFNRSNSFRANRTTLVRRNQSMSAKQIRFYRNGDRFFGGLKLAVSSERYKEFDSLLAELSEKLDLASGAVRCVFNAEDGFMITDISQLQYGISYVCSSTTTYRQIENGYGKHQPQWILSKKHTSKSTTSLTSSGGEGSFLGMTSREGSGRDYIKPKLVTVIKNGKPPQRKVTMLLNSKTAISFDQVLDHLSAKGSVGKVDKLFTVDGKLIKDLRDLFDDDTVFIAFMAAEKFPEEGVELDPFSYKVTPYRELKRPSNLKRASSLRIQRKYKDENENMSAIKSMKVTRPKSIGPGAKLTGSVKAARPKSNGIKKQSNGDISKEELYPASVFERESSDSAKKMIRGGQQRNKSPSATETALDVYNTVWMSDFESCKSSVTNQSPYSTSVSPRSFQSLNSPTDDDLQTQQSRHHHNATVLSTGEPASSFDDDIIFDERFERLRRARMRLHRSLSLPESELAIIDAKDLQERFTLLQVEQENKELRQLTRELQQALEALEQRFIEASQPPEPPLSAYSADLAWSFFSSPQFDDLASESKSIQKDFKRQHNNQIARKDIYHNKAPNCCIAQ